MLKKNAAHEQCETMTFLGILSSDAPLFLSLVLFLLPPDLHFPACLLKTWENQFGQKKILPCALTSKCKQRVSFSFLHRYQIDMRWYPPPAQQLKDLASANTYYTFSYTTASCVGFVISSNAVCSLEMDDAQKTFLSQTNTFPQNKLLLALRYSGSSLSNRPSSMLGWVYVIFPTSSADYSSVFYKWFPLSQLTLIYVFHGTESNLWASATG